LSAGNPGTLNTIRQADIPFVIFWDLVTLAAPLRTSPAAWCFIPLYADDATLGNVEVRTVSAISRWSVFPARNDTSSSLLINDEMLTKPWNSKGRPEPVPDSIASTEATHGGAINAISMGIAIISMRGRVRHQPELPSLPMIPYSGCHQSGQYGMKAVSVRVRSSKGLFGQVYRNQLR